MAKNTRLIGRNRDMSFIKPNGCENYLTLQELCNEVGKQPDWIRELEKARRIPRARRVPWGNIEGGVRLWSPKQVEEIRDILSRMRPGRPRKDA